MNFLILKSFKAKNPKTNKRCYGTLGYRQHSGLGNLKKNNNTILNKIDLGEVNLLFSRKEHAYSSNFLLHYILKIQTTVFEIEGPCIENAM